MTNGGVYENAVLDDEELQENLKNINPKFGDFVIRVAGEAWGLPLIDQKTKALITIAVDIVNQNHTGPGNPFAAHVNMALKQGATREEIEELLLFMCVYAGFNKVAGCFARLNEVFEQSSDDQRGTAMVSVASKADYAIRDRKGKVVFYVLLWKKKGISSEIFSDYWRNVHGPLCARLPGQHQYWQFLLDRNEDRFWPTFEGVDDTSSEEDRFDAIAELTFATEADRQTFFQSSGILMADEQNIFSKAIGYNTSPGNSQTYLDGIPKGDPNGKVDAIKFHVMVKKAETVSVEEFRKYMSDTFAPAIVQNESVLKFRTHLFDEVDNSRPEASGVLHSEPLEKQYNAAFEIAFANPLEMKKFFASKEYAAAVKDLAKYVQQLLPFSESSAHTFVYDSKMTVAGQWTSKIADLIAKVETTHHVEEDVVSLMNTKEDVVSLMNNSTQNGKSGLGHYLQGVQHFGFTVYDMDKAMEFYTEVLGGKVALKGDGFIGPVLHNTLFQKEDIEAIERGVDPKTLGVVNLRDGSDAAIDVRFVSFGNTCVELIHFRDAKLSPKAPNILEKVPSCVGFANVPHLSFYVKDDVDLNLFAKTLEEECQRRGLTEVVFNRVIDVKSKAERDKLHPRYNANKFWNNSEYFIEGYSDLEFGDFQGWSLFYCKGPNGEQLEFNQVTRKAKENFTRAEAEYNEANGTNYWYLNSQRKPNTNTNGLYGSYSTPVNASLETVWDTLLDKMENPGRYMPYVVEDLKVLQKFDDGVLREVKTPEMHVIERVTVDEKAKKITYDIVNYPMFTASFINQVTPPENHGSQSLPQLVNVFHLKPITDTALEQEEAKHFIAAAQPELIEKATLYLKQAIENKIPQREQSMTQTPVRPTTAGPKSEIVRQMFLAGESMNVDNFVKFYTDDCLYQFSNFPVSYGHQGIKDSSVDFLNTVAKVYHHIKNIWEQGDTVICEMEVTYIRHDGKVFRLPCCDTIIFRGDKVQELRIYMDISPVFETPEEVPSQPAASSGTLMKTLEKMYEALHAEDWDKFMTFFTPNLLYKIGANEPVIGPQACRDLLKSIYRTLKLTTHNTRGAWEINNTIILEMDANYVHKSDRRFVQVPCVDIYRFEGDKIYEWRVYPDASATGVQV